MFLTEYEVLMG